MSEKYISLDIDGILNDYPHCWIRYLNGITGYSFISKDDALKTISNEEYKKIKHDYRTSDYKANLEINIDALNFCKALVDKGYQIIISTSRPIKNELYPNLYNLTFNWLTKNEIPFGKLLYKELNKSFIDQLPPIIYHVDDDLQFAEFFASYGIKSYFYTTENSSIFSKNVIPFNSFEYLLSITE